MRQDDVSRLSRDGCWDAAPLVDVAHSLRVDVGLSWPPGRQWTRSVGAGWKRQETRFR